MFPAVLRVPTPLHPPIAARKKRNLGTFVGMGWVDGLQEVDLWIVDVTEGKTGQLGYYHDAVDESTAVLRRSPDPPLSLND